MSAFFDTNILIYSLEGDQVRSRIAGDVVASGGWISVQVLNEVTNVLRRKLRREWAQVDVALQVFRSTLNVIPLTSSIHVRGVALARRYDFAIYDAMIVAAAMEAECSRLYTEDMHHGLTVDDRLTILNPFV
ncbi:hypothetical protein ASG29_08060 [Sphingomonas sp. Leaf412]|uniref:PIN domain-containing protein n=1 Tax=Sphingomonas sp. Leaf412 TaxID=1736370 RepID=UPI0006FDF361|nr:PIN domain-containing protein [Sphingomonas sp. Leaf412]KQT31843.1 hypothetical protein ASG29_08060 [Sphingomonas sp. Leaf412]